MHLIKSGLDLHFCQVLRITGLYIKDFCHLVNIQISIKFSFWDYDIDKVDIRIKENF